MEFYHVNKDYEYWTGNKWESAADEKPEPKPDPNPQPTKTSKPRVKSFSMVENGETIGISMLVSNEIVRINGMMV